MPKPNDSILLTRSCVPILKRVREAIPHVEAAEIIRLRRNFSTTINGVNSGLPRRLESLCRLRREFQANMHYYGAEKQAELTRILQEGEEAVLKALRDDKGPSEEGGQREDQIRFVGLHGILERAEGLAKSDLPILLNGETGVGKEVVARMIHEKSRRARGPFIPVDCGTTPRDIMNSLFFGHRKGAFTGAIENHEGYFEQARGGTLFLDEIGNLTPELQAALLRVLDGYEFWPVGSKRPVQPDVRIVTATNSDLEAEIERGAFRDDLYYRLNGAQISIPPLRERPNEIEELVLFFIERLKKRYPISGITPGALKFLKEKAWPGNVRELRNVLEQAAAFSTHGQLEIADFPLELHREEGRSLTRIIGGIPAGTITKALERHGDMAGLLDTIRKILEKKLK